MLGSRIVIFLVMLSVILGAAWYFHRSLEPTRSNWKVTSIPAGPARLKLPLVSIKSRLPQGKPVTPSQPLDKEAKERWGYFDMSLEEMWSWRTYYLKTLHEDTTSLFLRDPNNGADRMYTPPSMIYLDDSYRRLEDQPGEPATFGKSPDEAMARGESQRSLNDEHSFAMRSFLSPEGWGYVRDRDHVAGFESHGFRRYTEFRKYVLEKSTWFVDHIELVGILTQPEPIVYMTDKMPSMEQIKKGTTRKLDAFEEKGLKELARGEDLFIIEKDNTLRMLGALRATKSCLQCHDTAKEYDLMGAFSYTIRRNVAVNPADKPKDEGAASGAGS
jgi:hypothetical protein